jgi:Niemann-Pick C1 protein
LILSFSKAKTFSTLLIDSKITLGLGGVVIVLAAVAASVGFFANVGVPATLIIIEVIPFLVLAVGTDNIFILVHAYERSPRRKGETIEEHVGRVLGHVGPSMMMTAAAEWFSSFLGALTGMPAVRAFALYAGLALVFDFFLQVSPSLQRLNFLQQGQTQVKEMKKVTKEKTKRKKNIH